MSAWVFPDRFRFSDVNPVTGEVYARSVFEDLPPFVQAVVEDVVGLSARRWDELLWDGELSSVVGPFRWFALGRFLASVSRRTGSAPKGACPDCWGTLAVEDWDGSMTGTVGLVYLCECTTPASSPSRLMAVRV